MATTSARAMQAQRATGVPLLIDISGRRFRPRSSRGQSGEAAVEDGGSDDESNIVPAPAVREAVDADVEEQASNQGKQRDEAVEEAHEETRRFMHVRNGLRGARRQRQTQRQEQKNCQPAPPHVRLRNCKRSPRFRRCSKQNPEQTASRANLRRRPDRQRERRRSSVVLAIGGRQPPSIHPERPVGDEKPIEPLRDKIDANGRDNQPRHWGAKKGGAQQRETPPSGSAANSDHPRMALACRRRGRTDPCPAEPRFARPSIRYGTPSRRLVSMGSLSVPRLSTWGANPDRLRRGNRARS